MSLFARQSTADTFIVGPILDADGVAVTDAVIGDLKLSKNGADPVAFDGAATLTHRHTGHYSLMATADDLDTVGQAEVVIDDTTNVMPVKTVTVLEEAVYDALFDTGATGLLPANVTQWLGTAPRALVDQNVQTHVRDGGYEGGYIWIDNHSGVAGTTPFVNGTRQNPCEDLVDAYAVGVALGIFAFKLVPHSYGGTDFPLVPNGKTLDLQGAGGGGLVLDLNGRYTSIGPGTFGGFIPGVNEVLFSSIPGASWGFGEPSGLGSYYDGLFLRGIGEVELGSQRIGNCAFDAGITRLLFTLTSSEPIELYECSFNKVEGDPVVFDMNDVIDEGEGPFDAPRRILLTACYGPVRIENMQASNSRVHYPGWGKLVIDRTTCTDGSVVVTTHVAVEDEAGNQYKSTNKAFMVGDVSVKVRTQEDGGDIDGFTRDQALRVIAAATAGVLSGGPSTPEMLGLDKATARITGTADSFGNRTDVTYDGGS